MLSKTIDWDAFEERVCQKVEKRVSEKIGPAFRRVLARLDEMPEIPSAVEALGDLPPLQRTGERPPPQTVL